MAGFGILLEEETFSTGLALLGIIIYEAIFTFVADSVIGAFEAVLAAGAACADVPVEIGGIGAALTLVVFEDCGTTADLTTVFAGAFDAVFRTGGAFSRPIFKESLHWTHRTLIIRHNKSLHALDADIPVEAFDAVSSALLTLVRFEVEAFSWTERAFVILVEYFVGLRIADCACLFIFALQAAFTTSLTLVRLWIVEGPLWTYDTLVIDSQV